MCDNHVLKQMADCNGMLFAMQISKLVASKQHYNNCELQFVFNYYTSLWL